MTKPNDTRISLPSAILEVYRSRAKAMKRTLKAQLEYTLEQAIASESQTKPEKAEIVTSQHEEKKKFVSPYAHLVKPMPGSK